jgi:hypothetical protein
MDTVTGGGGDVGEEMKMMGLCFACSVGSAIE